MNIIKPYLSWYLSVLLSSLFTDFLSLPETITLLNAICWVESFIMLFLPEERACIWNSAVPGSDILQQVIWFISGVWDSVWNKYTPCSFIQELFVRVQFSYTTLNSTDRTWKDAVSTLQKFMKLQETWNEATWNNMPAPVWSKSYAIPMYFPLMPA